ncbi:hypothetical protein SDRG_01416 [Saprolegnia diclina VS20]|uniref:Uncharacterized protein n=1 Tax=Saprolegnia diclina (strain VS20) TaxID=1156394 RepID=T0S895_SAPDV|nr:hypothetical protein SDRG_01416 [Saprolegnia diclina VS20]EQC41448.1 hypothetical protein SDRG_01416 [Saprolegnia diclina VS20]|eukprot:XP_008605162.1 hypothetical protein SDRG_01416 [Saprolegnia diclina VS20]
MPHKSLGLLLLGSAVAQARLSYNGSSSGSAANTTATSDGYTLYGAWFTAGIVVVYMGMVASFIQRSAPDHDVTVRVGLDSNFVSVPVLEAKS